MTPRQRSVEVATIERPTITIDMVEKLRGEKFYQRAGLWDGQNLRHAVDAFEARGAYNVEKVPLYVDGGHATGLYATAVVLPNEWPPSRVFGVVSEDWQLVTPRQIAETWDEAFGEPNVEYLHIMNGGRRMLIQTPLPDLTVGGDTLKMYASLLASFDASRAINIFLTPVRAWCTNTLPLALRRATMRYRMPHRDEPRDRIRDVLMHIHEQALARYSVVQDFVELLQSVPATPTLADQLFSAAYPERQQPRPEQYRDPDKYDEVHERWDSHRTRMHTMRALSRDLFMNNPPTNETEPTLWDAYNAVTETENWRNWRSQDSRLTTTMIGERANAMQRAERRAVDLAANADLRAAFGAVGDA